MSTTNDQARAVAVCERSEIGCASCVALSRQAQEWSAETSTLLGVELGIGDVMSTRKGCGNHGSL